MNYIDVLIPGIIGLLLVISPQLFTKADGRKGEQARAKLRTIGFVLIGVAILYLFVKVLGNPPPNKSLQPLEQSGRLRKEHGSVV
jgi:uncharacterized protein YjeT (DUF2065 family)